MTLRRRSPLVVLVLGLALTSGCFVRTAPSRGRSHHGAHGSDHHCHERGGKHKKRVCHAHPHGPDHH